MATKKVAQVLKPKSPAVRTRRATQKQIEIAASLLSPRAQGRYEIRMPGGASSALCASLDSPPAERQQLASNVLDTVGNLLEQFPYEDGDSKALAYHIVWACQWLTAVSRGLLNSLDLPQEGA
jgi:hypothetical protein